MKIKLFDSLESDLLVHFARYFHKLRCVQTDGFRATLSAPTNTFFHESMANATPSVVGVHCQQPNTCPTRWPTVVGTLGIESHSAGNFIADLSDNQLRIRHPATYIYHVTLVPIPSVGWHRFFVFLICSNKQFG